MKVNDDDAKVREKVFAKGDPKARLRDLVAALPTFDLTSDTAIEEAIKALESFGLKPRESPTVPVGPMRYYVSMRGENRGGAPNGTPELYFTDPDGILGQLQDVKYCGGGGYLGDACPPVA